MEGKTDRASHNTSLTPPSQTSEPADSSSPVIPTSPPPFWSPQQRTSSAISYHSTTSVTGIPIQLEDHSEDRNGPHNKCWARQVTIDDYTVISGATGIGAYVVWNCTVETIYGASFAIIKRYSEFDALREQLINAFPHSIEAIPPLPRKSVISRFRPRFLDKRKIGLSHFLSCVLLNPEFVGSPVLRAFIFA